MKQCCDRYWLVHVQLVSQSAELASCNESIAPSLVIPLAMPNSELL